MTVLCFDASLYVYSCWLSKHETCVGYELGNPLEQVGECRRQTGKLKDSPFMLNTLHVRHDRMHVYICLSGSILTSGLPAGTLPT